MNTEQEEDDALYDWFLSTLAECTPEEIAKQIKDANECADYIRKHGITPNLDSPY